MSISAISNPETALLTPPTMPAFEPTSTAQSTIANVMSTVAATASASLATIKAASSATVSTPVMPNFSSSSLPMSQSSYAAHLATAQHYSGIIHNNRYGGGSASVGIRTLGGGAGLCGTSESKYGMYQYDDRRYVDKHMTTADNYQPTMVFCLG